MVTPASEGIDGGRSGNASRQRTVYRAYIKLQKIAAEHFQAPSLGGKLIASGNFAQHGAETAVAVSIAGGCFLGIDPDQNLLKEAVRNGSCDFMVNSLDEALRVLKNEIRKGQPLATGLLGNPADVFAEMLERGVQPDIVAADSTDGQELWNRFIERGAVSMRLPRDEATRDAIEVAWTASRGDIHRMDEGVLNWLPAQDEVRRRWIQQSETRFYRHSPIERVLEVSSEELPTLIVALKQSGPGSGKWTIRWRAAGGMQQSVEL